MTKTALLAVGRGFAEGAAGTGVTVNPIIAGPTRTGDVEDVGYEPVDRDLARKDAQRVLMREHRPPSLLQRLIEPEEIAHMVVYLSSPQASATTGAAVRVDGGHVDSFLPRPRPARFHRAVGICQKHHRIECCQTPYRPSPPVQQS